MADPVRLQRSAGDYVPRRRASGEPCHADILLEIANRPVCEAVA